MTAQEKSARLCCCWTDGRSFWAALVTLRFTHPLALPARALGAPARVKGPLEGLPLDWVSTNPAYYAELAQRHRAGITQI